jgi:hypothetical protein
VNAKSETIYRAKARPYSLEIEAEFQTNYSRIARVIARVVRDPSRAEELAVEVFYRLWRDSGVAPDATNGCTRPPFGSVWTSSGDGLDVRDTSDSFEGQIQTRRRNNCIR